MEKKMKRLVINAKDIALITGNSVRYGRDLIREIKLKNHKKPWQRVSITEFAEYMVPDSDEVRENLQ